MTEILVCKPTYFGIEYEINPWMSMNKDADPEFAMFQWDRMCNRLKKAGARIRYIEPQRGLPDMVFTANAGLVYKNTVILSNFRHQERREEKKLFKEWFLRNGYRVVELPESVCFEGEGDALFFKGVLFMGSGFRTDPDAHSIIGRALDIDVVSCELVDPRFYHLDTCFLPLKDRIVYYRDAFSKFSQHIMIQKLIEIGYNSGTLDVLNVHEDQAKEFICNSIEIDETVVTPTDMFSLSFSGKKTLVSNMSEFMKSGGAVKCLTLRL
tara:strand:+ start:43138 stop:43938 length:801 start_codon:yes stop_codon:yes gene_type:complete